MLKALRQFWASTPSQRIDRIASASPRQWFNAAFYSALLIWLFSSKNNFGDFARVFDPVAPLLLAEAALIVMYLFADVRRPAMRELLRSILVSLLGGVGLASFFGVILIFDPGAPGVGPRLEHWAVNLYFLLKTVTGNLLGWILLIFLASVLRAVCRSNLPLRWLDRFSGAVGRISAVLGVATSFSFASCLPLENQWAQDSDHLAYREGVAFRLELRRMVIENLPRDNAQWIKAVAAKARSVRAIVGYQGQESDLAAALSRSLGTEVGSASSRDVPAWTGAVENLGGEAFPSSETSFVRFQSARAAEWSVLGNKISDAENADSAALQIFKQAVGALVPDVGSDILGAIVDNFVDAASDRIWDKFGRTADAGYDRLVAGVAAHLDESPATISDSFSRAILFNHPPGELNYSIHLYAELRAARESPGGKFPVDPPPEPPKDSKGDAGRPSDEFELRRPAEADYLGRHE